MFSCIKLISADTIDPGTLSFGKVENNGWPDAPPIIAHRNIKNYLKPKKTENQLFDFG